MSVAGSMSVTGHTSLKLCRTGPSGPPADPGDRTGAQLEAKGEVGHAERPGHGRLDRRHVAHHHDVALGAASPDARLSEQLVARLDDALLHLSQRLAALGTEPGVVPPAPPHLGGHVTKGTAVELSVVDLDPALVDRRRQSEPELIGGVSGAKQRARANLGHRWGRAQQLPDRNGLAQAERGELGVGAPEEQPVGVAHRLPVSHQDQHGQTGTRIRPHCSHVATWSGGRARIFSTSTEDSSRWQPSQRVPMRRAAPVPLRRARNVS